MTGGVPAFRTPADRVPASPLPWAAESAMTVFFLRRFTSRLTAPPLPLVVVGEKRLDLPGCDSDAVALVKVAGEAARNRSRAIRRIADTYCACSLSSTV